jgi:ankyrin repeat protein
VHMHKRIESSFSSSEVTVFTILFFQMKQKRNERAGPKWNTECDSMVNQVQINEILQNPGAFIYKHKKIPRTLIKKFIDSRVPETGETLLTQACIRGNSMAARILVKHGQADTNQLGYVHSFNLHGEATPLGCAASDGNMLLVAFLFQTGHANLDISMDRGKTPLYQACRWGHTEIVEYFLKHGATVDKITEKGRTAFLVASKWQRCRIINALLEHGANINHKDKDKNTALHLAAKKSQEKTLRMLLKYGAKSSENKQGFTPLEIGGWEASPHIIQILSPTVSCAAERIRTYKLMTARYILAGEKKEAFKWQTKYRALVDTEGMKETGIDLTSNPMIQAIMPLQIENETHTNGKDNQYWQEQCLLLLMEKFASADEHVIDQLKLLGKLAMQNKQYQKALAIFRIILEHEETCSAYVLRRRATHLDNLAHLIGRIRKKAHRIPWENCKQDANKLLQISIRTWKEEQAKQFALFPKPHRLSFSGKNQYQDDMHNIYRAALTCACSIIIYEGTQHDAESSQLLVEFLHSNMEDREGNGPLLSLVPRIWSGFSGFQHGWGKQKTLEVIKHLFQMSPDINRRNNRGQTLLHLAIYRIHEFSYASELIDLAAQHGAHVDIKNCDGDTIEDLIVQSGSWNSCKSQKNYEILASAFKAQPHRLECLAATACTQTWKLLTIAKKQMPTNTHHLLEMHALRSPGEYLREEVFK